MGLLNSLRKQVDRPAWEWLRFAPVVSSAISCSTIAQNANFHVQHGRYIYYFISGTQFWKYDTWTDTYIQLASPPASPSTYNSIRFLSSYGYEGRVLAGAAGSITIPAYFGQALKGYDVTIVSGTGAGQRRVISSVADAVVADSGVPTAVTTGSITDSTKAWTVNQYAGYQVRIVLGPGISQVRKILYNSATTLTFADVNKYPEDAFCNAAAPSPALSTTAGSQSLYQIESSVASVDQNWTVTPDATSRFRGASGAILLANLNLTASSSLVYYYDVAADLWYVKTYQTNLIASFISITDGSIEVSDETATTWDRGFASSGTTTTLVDATKSWTTNQYIGYWVYIAYGTAAGQIRKITANTSTQLTFSAGTAVDTTSSYMIIGYDGGTATAGGASTLTDSAQAWAVNRWKNYAVRILTGTGAGQALPIASNTATALTTVRPWLTQPDSTSVYVIVPNQDIATVIVANASRSIIFYGIDDDMWFYGRWQDSGAARIGAYQYAGFKPCAIASITKSGTTATVTTVNPISFPSGSTVTISGATGADAATYNITAAATITGANTFTYTMGGTPAANAVFGSLSTTTLIDSTKSWTTNQWAGYLCHMANTAGPNSTGQSILITSNTANTLTFVAAVTIPANGVTRYVITPNSCPGALATGTATGTQTGQTSLVDTSQNWVVNQWAGRNVRLLSGGPQEGFEASITSNTSNTLTVSNFGGTPTNGVTTYAIIAQPTVGTGVEIRHAFGTSDAANRGKFLVMNRGGGSLGFGRLNVTTDQFENMATSPNSETLSTGTMLAYDGIDRIYFTKETTQRVYYLDVVTGQIHGAGVYPYVAGTAVIGNRMEIFTTADGLKFLWLNRHSNLECFRNLLFW